MTVEEMEAKIVEQEAQITQLGEVEKRFKELEEKLTPKVDDPDDAYKPKSWKELDERETSKAEAAALKVLQDADKKKEDLKKQEEEDLKKQDEIIGDALKKLQEEGIIEETKDKEDAGGKQRAQILGMTLRNGGTNVEAAGRALKTAWDAGMEYDYESNSFRRAGSPSQYRNAPVASSAARTAPAPKSGPINLKGIGGDLDEAQRRWEEKNR